jgi:hypothetical protein
MAGAGAIRRALGDLSLQLRVEQVIPALDFDAQALNASVGK